MSNSTQFSFPIKVTVPVALKIIYIIGAAFSLVRAFLSWGNEHSVVLSLFLIAVSVLCGYAFLLSRSTISVDNDAIIVSAPHGLYKIEWAEVETIETKGRTIIAFIGNNKHLVINLLLASKGKREFYNFLNSELINNRQIKVMPLSSGRISQKNTKIS